jgi:hypothetical protein
MTSLTQQETGPLTHGPPRTPSIRYHQAIAEAIDLGRRGKNVKTDLGVCSKITITTVNGFPFLRPRVESCILIQYVFSLSHLRRS